MCVYGGFCRDSIKYTVMYGVYIYGSGQPYKHPCAVSVFRLVVYWV